MESKKESNEPVNWDTKAQFCYNVADGLRALHAANIVHGDLKGDNILLFLDSENKDELVAKVTDFGYSATEHQSRKVGVLVGHGTSLHQNAPQQHLTK